MKRISRKRVLRKKVGGVLLGLGVLLSGAAVSPAHGLDVPSSDSIAAYLTTADQGGSEDAVLLAAAAEESPAASADDVQRSIDELRRQIDSLQDQMSRKQNIPDTLKKFGAQAGGFLDLDAVTISQNEENKTAYGDINNDFAVRDLWLWVRGEGYGNIDYAVMLAFPGSLAFRDVVLNVKNLPVLGTVRTGYFKVESGLNNEQFVYDNTFVDWESCTRTFMAGRRLGVASIHYNEDKTMRLFTGVFTGKNLSIGDGMHSNEDCDNPGTILNTRLTALPIYRANAAGDICELLHLGAGFRWVNPGKDSETGQIRRTALGAVPADWLADMPSLLAGQIDSNSYSVTNIEAAWQRGQFGLVSEGYVGSYNGYDNAYGVSTTGRLLLTPGAYQKYNKVNGCFGGIAVPNNMQFVDFENWTCLEGWGVWEVAAQWAWTDLDMLRDAPVSAHYGKMNQFTLGLNWHWNPQTRWGINWIHAKPESGAGSAEAVASSLNTLAFQGRITF